MQPKQKLSPVITTLIIIVMIGIVTTAVVIVRNQSKGTTTSDSGQTESPQNQTSNDSANNANEAYIDGTYTETGNYITPGGRETIKVTVTLANDIITEASVTGDATSGESKEHQSDFIGGFKKLVVGKDIDEVSLSRVAGSSLTSNGFNTALKLIKADAQA